MSAVTLSGKGNMEVNKMTKKTTYERLTLDEREYIEQDGSTEADINESNVWDIIEFLIPMYGRDTDEWKELIERLTA